MPRGCTVSWAKGGGPFRVSVNGLKGPGERISDKGNQLVWRTAEGSRFPATSVVGDLEEPDVDAIAREAQLLVRVVLGT